MADDIYSYTHPTDTAVGWAAGNRILALGEVGYDSTNNQLRAGNGVDTWALLTPIAANAGGTVDQTARDLAQQAIDAAAAKYTKPVTGIPDTDLASTFIKTVNGNQPDGSGNIVVSGGGSGGAVSSVAGKTGDVTLNKTDVGLANVDNTSDANKPVSSAQQAALNAKADAARTITAGGGLTGGGDLSTNRTIALSTATQTSLAKADTALQAAPVTSVAGKTGAVTLAKGDVGLANVDNTSDANKPVSSAQQAALDTKVAQSDVYVWSQPNNAAGPGPGGVIVDSTAAPNVARNTSAKASEGYVAIGREALGAATRARACIAIGSLALGRGNPGFGNLAVGAFALSNVQGVSEYAADLPGSRNIGVGSLTGYFLTSGYMNAFVGRDAGQTTTTGYRNSGFGYGAFSRGIAPVGIDGTIVNQYPTTGNDNTAVGTQAAGMLAGSNTVAVGSAAASNVRASDNNVFIGASAAGALGSTTSENNLVISSPNTTGTYSQSGNVITITATAHGASVGKRVAVTFTSGQISTITGESQWLAVASVTSADVFTLVSPVSQTASGAITLNKVETTTAAQVVGANVVIGYQAQADALLTSGNNVYIGEQVARPATGANNTAVGSRAGFNMTTGQQNTFLGFNAGRALSTGGGLTTSSNCTVLGYNAAPSADNQVQLGDSRTTTYVYGTVQNRSDIRDKADVRDTALGLDFINALRPVDYRWDMREDYIERDEDGNVVAVHERDGSKKRERYHHGVIAQELPAEFGGLQDHALAGGDDVMSVGYDEFIAPLIKSVQELTAEVANLKVEIADLRGH